MTRLLLALLLLPLTLSPQVSTDDDILKADGILLGSPVHWGNVSPEAKRLLDRIGNVLWARKRTGDGRTAGVFTTSGRANNGTELTRLSMISAFLEMEFIVIGGEDGGYGTIGAVATVPPDAHGPTKAALDAAHRMGERFATLTRQLRSARK